MEVLPEGKNFRLVQEEELPAILDFLGKYLPDSIKVRKNIFLIPFLQFLLLIMLYYSMPTIIKVL